jgi:hypothetical protein
MTLGELEALADQFHIPARRAEAVGRFLPEAVQHINRLGKAPGADSAKGISSLVFNQLHHAYAWWLGLRRSGARLHK